MSTRERNALTCAVCGQPKPKSDLVPAAIVRPSVSELIRHQYPTWSPDSLICREDLTHFRGLHVRNLLEAEKGELTELEDTVVQSLREHDPLSTNIDADFEQDLSFGARLADTIATFGGSWAFIIVFGVFILLWITVNVLTLLWKPPDPYPFILLNLMLSCLAALQAPVIMMSQNRPSYTNGNAWLRSSKSRSTCSMRSWGLPSNPKRTPPRQPISRPGNVCRCGM